MALGEAAGRPPGRLRALALAAAVSTALGLIALPARADDQPAEPASSTAPETVPATPGDPPVTSIPSGPVGPSAGGVGPSRSPADGEPTQAGGGALPGQRPGPASDSGALPGSDGTAPIDPTFVDDYGNVWRAIQAGKAKVRTLSRQVVAADRVVADAIGDLAVATRVRNRAEFTAVGAQAQFAGAVRGLYIQGTTDVDLVMGVLGSRPDDLLRTIDSVVYLRSATGRQALSYASAQDFAVAAQSAAAATRIRADDASARADAATAALTKARKKLADDEAELARLVSVAQPQTVVGPGGCPTQVLAGTVPDGVSVSKLCKAAVRNAATPQSAFAVKWAMVRLGAPYACEGIGRLEPWRYDCSSYVSRAYAEGAGLGTAGDGWAPSTRNMVPWDGAALDRHYAVIPPSQIRPGDLVLYDTCPAGQTCSYRHVVMYLGPQEKGGVPMMAHTNACGSVAHVSPFTGTDVANFLGVRRVVPVAGERIVGGSLAKPAAAKKPAATKKPRAGG